LSSSGANGFENSAPEKIVKFELKDDMFSLSQGILDTNPLDFTCATIFDAILDTKASNYAKHVSMVLGWSWLGG
jgi:hypothetical protein